MNRKELLDEAKRTLANIPHNSDYGPSDAPGVANQIAYAVALTELAREIRESGWYE